MSRKQFVVPPSDWFLPALVGGALVRAVFVSRHGYWHDEAYSILMADRASWTEVLHFAGRSQFGAPLYYLWLHGWLLLGRDEWVVRGLSVLGSVAALWASLALVREAVPGRQRAAAAWLAALSPISIAYAQEARVHSWLSACEAMALLALWRGLKDPDSPWARRYAVFLGGSALLHPGLWLWWGAGAVCVAVARHRARLWRTFAAATLPAAAVTAVGWVAARDEWRGKIMDAYPLPVPGEFLREAATLFTAGHHAGPVATRLLPWVAALLVLLAGWRMRGVPAERQGLGVLVAHALLPVAAVWTGIAAGASSQLRYILVVAPVAMMLFAAGSAALPRPLRHLLLAALLAAQAEGWARSLTLPPTLEPSFCLHSRKPVREAAAFIASSWRAGDLVVHCSTASYLPMRLYLPNHPQSYVLDNPDFTPDVTRPLLGAPEPLGDLLRRARRIWLVSCPWRFADPPSIPGSWRVDLDRRCGLPVRYPFPGLDVYLAPVASPP